MTSLKPPSSSLLNQIIALNKSKQNADNTRKIFNLITELASTFCNGPKKEVTKLSAHALQYFIQCPHAFGYSDGLSESDCVNKIYSKLQTHSTTATATATATTTTTTPNTDTDASPNLFLKLYSKMHKMPLDVKCRRKLLHFFLLAMQPGLNAAADESEVRGASDDIQKHLNNMITNSLSQTDSIESPSSLSSTRLNQQSSKSEAIIHDVVQSAIYSFTGIQSKYLKKDVITGCFKLDAVNVRCLTLIEANMLMRLSELGIYYERVSNYGNPAKGYTAIGSMGQAYIALLQNELTTFQGQVAALQDKHLAYQSSVRHSCMASEHEQLTLMQLLSWSQHPLKRLQWLAKISDECQIKKGGNLASTVYKHLNNGDPVVNALVEKMLNSICGPLARMISHWILNGGINDPFKEFFIDSLTKVDESRLWHDKFRLNQSMLPEFIPKEWAEKILKAGKNINFLSELCDMHNLIKKADIFKNIIENNVQEMFAYVQDSPWHEAIETIYQQTSKQVLDFMVGPQKLFEHLQSIRQYLLLGKGDFVSLLIENIKEELEKNATELSSYDLSAMLDAALRATNPNSEDLPILNHLDIAMQTAYPGDCGWNIITLQYVVHGPIGAMIEPSMLTYKALFRVLWRMKQMEYVLSTKVWKEQMGNSKLLRSMDDEIGETSYNLHLFTSEIMHFFHQMQYYVNFEVIECNWVEFQKQMSIASDLDEIMNAHDNFLKTISAGLFINASPEISSILDRVYNNIFTLENWQSHFYNIAINELMARKQYERKIYESEALNVFGVTIEESLERDQEKKIFQQNINARCTTLKTIAAAHETAVCELLLALHSSSDPNLQLLGTRLDFNEYYKKRDLKLSLPLTFVHIRMSQVYVSPKNNKAKYAFTSECD